MITNLTNLQKGETATVNKLLLNGSIKRRLLDLGLIEGTKIECLHKNSNDKEKGPIAYLIRGAVICLRYNDASSILVNN